MKRFLASLLAISSLLLLAAWTHGIPSGCVYTLNFSQSCTSFYIVTILH
jgi:hypothetical protein